MFLIGILLCIGSVAGQFVRIFEQDIRDDSGILGNIKYLAVTTNSANFLVQNQSTNYTWIKFIDHSYSDGRLSINQSNKNAANISAKEVRNYQGNRGWGPGNFLVIPDNTSAMKILTLVRNFDFSNQILVSNYMSTSKIRKGSIFGYSQNQVLTPLLWNTSNKPIGIGCTLFGANNSKVTVEINTTLSQTVEGYRSSKYCKNRIYIFTYLKIAIYDVYENCTIDQSPREFSTGGTNLSRLNTSMAVNQDYFVYSISDTVYIYNSTNFEFVRSAKFEFNITSFLLVPPCFLMFTDPIRGTLLRYDFAIGAIVQQMQSGILVNNSLSMFGNKYFYLTKAVLGLTTKIQIFQFILSYSCAGGCLECRPTYSLNWSTWKCDKIIQSSVEQGYIEYLNEVDNKTDDIAIVIGKVLSFSSSYIVPHFIASMILCLDEFWFYNYHRVAYPKSAEFYMNKIDLINTFRMSPWFLNAWDFINQNQIAKQQNQIYYNMLSRHVKNPKQAYFLHAAQDTYKTNLFLNIILYISLKLFQLLSYPLRNQYKLFQTIYEEIREYSKFWGFLAMFVQTNVMKVTFDCVIQLLLHGSFNFSNKINFSINILTLLILVIFSTCFYPLVFCYSSTASGKKLLIFTKYSMPGFFVESYSIVLRTFIKAFVHAVLIQNYQIQILALFTIDFFFFIKTIVFKSIFKSFTMFFLFLTYDALFFALDFIFYLNILGTQWPIKYNHLIFGIMSGIIVSSLCINLALLLQTIIQTFQSPKNKRIQRDYPNTKKSSEFKHDVNCQNSSLDGREEKNEFRVIIFNKFQQEKGQVWLQILKVRKQLVIRMVKKGNNYKGQNDQNFKRIKKHIKQRESQIKKRTRNKTSVNQFKQNHRKF